MGRWGRSEGLAQGTKYVLGPPRRYSRRPSHNLSAGSVGKLERRGVRWGCGQKEKKGLRSKDRSLGREGIFGRAFGDIGGALVYNEAILA